MDSAYLFHTIRVNVEYAGMQLKDVPDEKLATQFGDFVNHPAWSLGHLAAIADFSAAKFGRKGVVDPAWGGLFMKQKPSPDRSLYPGKDVLLKAVKESHENLIEGVKSADEAMLQKPVEGFNHPWFPNLGSLAHMIVLHDASHLGQVTAWRRLMGYPILF